MSRKYNSTYIYEYFFVGTKITKELYYDVQVENIKDPTKIGHPVDAI